MNIEVEGKFRKTANCSVGLLSIALMAAGVSPLLQGAGTPFTITPPLVEPIGVAYSSVVNKLLFTVPFAGTTGRKVMGVTDAGVSSLFATLPNRVSNPSAHPDAWEDYIAVSPGLGGFTKGAVFVTQGQNILQIPPTGGVPVLFVNITGLTDTHTGIAFDTVGTFGFQMLLTGQNSHVYAVNSAGVVTTLNALSAFSAPVAVENGQVAPLSWGVYGGWFIIPSELTGHVVALDPALTMGQHQIVVLTPGFHAPSNAPEAVRFVPTSPTNWGVSGGVYFDIVFATGGGTVLKFPASDFGPALQGQALIPDENDGTIRVLNATSSMMTPPVVGLFASGLARAGMDQEGSTFVTTPPQNGVGRMTGGGSVFEVDGTRVTHGFELHCEINDVPNRLEINWGGGNRFHLDTLTAAFCFTDPNIDSGHPPAPFNTYVGTGTGSFNGIPGATAHWTFTDAGEPGTNDTATILITDAMGNTVLIVSGKLDKGNQQAHKDNK